MNELKELATLGFVMSVGKNILISYVVAPFHFIGFRISTNFTVHVHIVAFRNGLRIDAATKTQSHLWRILNEIRQMK